jgi:hypothetical protein
MLHGGILYVLDHKFYTTFTGAKKRCSYLNEQRTQGNWIVMYQDRFKVYEE